MLISDKKAKEILWTLKQANVVHLVDNDNLIMDDGEGNPIFQEMEQWARVTFPINSNTYYDLFENFKAEFTSNRLVIGFNADLYCNTVVQHCESIKRHHTNLIINGTNVHTRADSIFKHYKIGEVETQFDTDGNPYDIPKPILLKNVPWDEIKPKILTEISEYFTYQEKILDIIIKYLRKGMQDLHVPRQYRSSYPYTYFKFDIANLEVEEESLSDYIIDFFNELVEKKYVESGSQKSLADFFNDKPSHKKVVWLRTKTELWYFIKSMIKKRYLINTNRETAKIICKVFTKPNGSGFVPKDFHSLHKPLHSKDLDMLLSILPPPGR